VIRASVLIPARNEQDDIARCLAAVLAQDLPPSSIEIVLVDGGSTDSTRAIAAKTLACHRGPHRIVVNPAGTTPHNLNAGLAVVSAPIVCRVDARSILPPHYVRTCIELLNRRTDLAVVGGAQVAVPPVAGPVGTGIARALNNRYGMGGSPYRAGASSQVTDTVYLGAFRTAQLRRIGGWDEALLTNQDYDCNRRMAARFGDVWFESTIPVEYRPRRTLRELGVQYRRFGRWKVRYWRHTSTSPSGRQRALLGLLPGVASVVVAALARPRDRPRRMAVITLLGVASLVAIEDRGTSGPPGSPPARAVACAALAVVGINWPLGVALELVAGDRR